MNRAAWLLIVFLLALLGAAIWMAVRTWNSVEGANGIPLQGGLALLVGTIGSIALGAGLMTLVFFSARSGHDETVHEEYRKRVPEDEE